MLRLVGRFFFLWDRMKNKALSAYIKSKFAAVGNNVYIGQRCVFTPETIHCGSNVYFGPNCVIQSAHGQIEIGNHVMFGPGVHIHGGNHVIDRIGGGYMDEITKLPGSDGIVRIEDDVWIGANAIILKGVTIHKGSVVGAGTIVLKDVSPYSVVVGNPGREIKKRFTSPEIVEYERCLEMER